MSKKKRKEPGTAGVYALAITTGLFIGLGLSPLMGNVLLMLCLGGLAGMASAFLITRNRPQHRHRRRH